MPKISEERRQQQRQRIIDATMTVLQERGFARSSMSQIIAASGMSAGAIYGYFPSKEELFREVARQVLGKRLGGLAQSPSGEVPPPEEALSAFFEQLREGKPGSKMIVQMWGEAVNDESMRAIAQQVLTEAKGAVEEYLVAWFTQEGEGDPVRRARETVGPVLALGQGAVLQSALLGGPAFRVEEGLRMMLK
ncbi:TetR/AcrR family transcriptional regulator [Corynebacterium oculi]|uniref:Putative HTH-type transcriptional regulator YfiR n=1 Tax=Corynebacterium oculi TaxID=1544416 RepID=A0A0Q0TWG2_9CORY|nr:TetR/AcrR family transcriptional regulator [Corynebacterium oculi]KQB83175.1 putative HTH-type transcriptional regulator YfiR [Corynebacterium oculi]